MASIGIMGGTFNPIHVGHIKIAQSAYEQFSLDEVWFMPNHTPAYKSDKELVSGKDRIAMAELAIQDISYFRTSDFELKREGATYTAVTITLLHEQYPKNDFYFIMGADSLYYFEKWKESETIARYATILVAPRGDKHKEELQRKITDMNCKYGSNTFRLIACPEIPCSSSEIREALRKEEGNRYQMTAEELFLPVSVFEYIIKHRLYV